MPHCPPRQNGAPLAVEGHGAQLVPQERTSVSDRQLPRHPWNPSAQTKSQLPKTQTAWALSGLIRVQSTHTSVPHSVGVFAQPQSRHLAAAGLLSSNLTSFEPLPQADAARTAAIAIRFAMVVSFPVRGNSEAREAAHLEAESRVDDRPARRGH